MNLRNTIAFICLLLITVPLFVPYAAAEQTCILSVTSIPDEGIISIDGRQQGATPIGLSLPCGNYSLEIAKNGYLPYKTGVILKDSEHKSIIANLEYRSNRGAILIRSEPSEGTLYIDGILQGTTPVQVDNLEYGRHSVLIQKPGYETFRDVVNAGPGTVPVYTEYLIPLPQSGFLGVTSVPDGAMVSLDGNHAGSSPTLLTRVSAGNHSVLIQKTGYENYTSIVNVPGGESVLVQADLLKIPDTGTIVIDSVPQGTEVYMNGTFKAVTPAVFEDVPQGTYFLQFRKRTYSELNTTVIMNGGETREVYVSMANGTSGFSRERVYLKHSNASQLLPGMNDATPSIDRIYTWYNNGHEATVRLRIPQHLYDHYKSDSHERGAGYLSRYALSESDRNYLHNLIGMLKDSGESKTFTARNDYQNVVAFVQAIEYTTDLDPVTNQKTDYWQYPVETLADGKGDCEDHAILAAALLKEMGYDVALVLLDDPTRGHAAVAIACENCNGYYYSLDGKKYYFLETTAYGSPLGVMDKYYEKIGADVIVL
jgi:hypothetical protein